VRASYERDLHVHVDESWRRRELEQWQFLEGGRIEIPASE
jgi:hypothetical protein